jgi:hypothetical protein
LAAVKGPFSYEALAPEKIEFIPLNQTKKMNGKELMEFYEVHFKSWWVCMKLTRRRKISISVASSTSSGTRQFTP